MSLFTGISLQIHDFIVECTTIRMSTYFEQTLILHLYDLTCVFFHIGHKNCSYGVEYNAYCIWQVNIFIEVCCKQERKNYCFTFTHSYIIWDDWVANKSEHFVFHLNGLHLLANYYFQSNYIIHTLSYYNFSFKCQAELCKWDHW